MWESLLCRTQSSGGWALSSQPARPGAPGALSGVVCGGRAPLGIRGSEMAGGKGERVGVRGRNAEGKRSNAVRLVLGEGGRGRRGEAGRQPSGGKGPETRRPGVREGRGRVNASLPGRWHHAVRGGRQRRGQPDGPPTGHPVPSPSLSVLLSDTWTASARVQSTHTRPVPAVGAQHGQHHALHAVGTEPAGALSGAGRLAGRGRVCHPT